VLVLLGAVPAAGQTRAVEFRPFVVASTERFAAQTTFKAVFGTASEPSW
jgi:hypothetical protein